MRRAIVRLRARRVEVLVRQVGLHLDERRPVDEVRRRCAGDASVTLNEAAEVADISLLRVRPERVVLRVKILAPFFRNDRLDPQLLPVNTVRRSIRLQAAGSASTANFEMFFVWLISQAAESFITLGFRYAWLRVDERGEVVSDQKLVHQHNVAGRERRMGVVNAELRQCPVDAVFAFCVKRNFAFVILLPPFLPMVPRSRVTSVVELKFVVSSQHRRIMSVRSRGRNWRHELRCVKLQRSPVQLANDVPIDKHFPLRADVDDIWFFPGKHTSLNDEQASNGKRQ